MIVGWNNETRHPSRYLYRRNIGNSRRKVNCEMKDTDQLPALVNQADVDERAGRP